MFERYFERYTRQICLAEISQAGQESLHACRVACIGAGGLGSIAAPYLAGAGVGTLHLYDHDIVNLHNLHRQVFYTEQDIGEFKSIVLAKRLKQLNSTLAIEAFTQKYTFFSDPISSLKPYDIIVDCTDQLQTKYLLNDACVVLSKPLVTASLYQFKAQCTTVFAPNGACLRCLYGDLDNDNITDILPRCETAGVIGMGAGIVGLFQALEVIRLRLNIGESFIGKMACWDFLSGDYQIFKTTQLSPCVLCTGQKIFDDLWQNEPEGISLAILQAQLASSTPPILIDLREPQEHQQYNIGGILIPLSELYTMNNKTPWDKNKAIILYCHLGQRSRLAAQWLKQQGYTQVSHLENGLQDSLEAFHTALRMHELLNSIQPR